MTTALEKISSAGPANAYEFSTFQRREIGLWNLRVALGNDRAVCEVAKSRGDDDRRVARHEQTVAHCGRAGKRLGMRKCRSQHNEKCDRYS